MMVEVDTTGIPTVTVIIPTHNRAELLGYAIRSVLSQTYCDFELIVVSDGSTDNTAEVVRLFGDPRISFVESPVACGASVARNIGIRRARGKYIAFLDDDDQWLPEKLQKQMKVFEVAPPEVGVVYTGLWKVDERGKTYIPSKAGRKDGRVYDELLKGNFVAAPAAMVKRECFGKAGMFDEEMPRLQDWEFFIRVSKYYDFAYIREPLLVAYCQTNGISADTSALIRAKELILAKHLQAYRPRKTLMARHYINISHLLVSRGETRRARGLLLDALRECPLSVSLALGILLTFLGRDVYSGALVLYRRIRVILTGRKDESS